MASPHACALALAPPVPVARDGPRPYVRREPEATLLHRTVRDHLESFLHAARDRSAHGRGLPAFVEKALRGYLDCGNCISTAEWARGFARVRCDDCGFERLVAFSCKARVCPSCNARRMEDTAEHLVRNVFPEVPVRQWVLTLPRQVRFLAARDKALTTRLLDVFTRAVFGWTRWRARMLRVDEPRTGGVTAVQRFGSALNLNVHFHTLVPDGVFDLSGEGRATFVRLSGPGPEELLGMLRRIVRRTAKLLAEAGEGGGDEDDVLAELQAAEVERRLRHPEPFELGKSSAYLDGFSLHAGVKVHENDRQGLERLCRYIARPPFALERLGEGEDGKLTYRMKRPRGGSRLLELTPEELLRRLATLVPPPGVHGIRYHGVFAPNAKGRARVVPAREPAAESRGPEERAPESRGPEEPVLGGPLVLSPEPVEGSKHERDPGARYRLPWAELLQKVFAVDVLLCPDCGGRLRVLACVTEAVEVKRYLEHAGIDATGPPVAKASAGGGAAGDPLPEYDLVDPIPEELRGAEKARRGGRGAPAARSRRRSRSQRETIPPNRGAGGVSELPYRALSDSKSGLFVFL